MPFVKPPRKMIAFSESRSPEVKYGYFRLEPDPSPVTSFGYLGMRGAGGAVKSDRKPDSLGAIAISVVEVLSGKKSESEFSERMEALRILRKRRRGYQIQGSPRVSGLVTEIYTPRALAACI